MFHQQLSDLRSHGSVAGAVRFITERLPVPIQAVCFCPSGVSAPTLFKSSEAKPSLSSRHGGLPPRGQLLLLLLTLDCTNSGTLGKLALRAYFCQSYASSGRPNLMSL